MDFTPSYADHNVWMHTPTSATSAYNYVIIYIDNLFASTDDPAQFFQDLQSSPWNYKLKGVGDPTIILGQISSVTLMAPFAWELRPMFNAS